MAKLKATPHTYAEAADYLKDRDSVKIGNNTLLERVSTGTDDQHIAVRLHNTRIVCFYPSGSVRIFTGGYHTSTTKERINQFVSGVVYQSNYNWFYSYNEQGVAHDVEFTEGMDISNL